MRTEQEIEEAALAAKGIRGAENNSSNGLFYSFKDYFKYHDDECLKIKITIIYIENENEKEEKEEIFYKNTCIESLELVKKVFQTQIFNITKIRVELVLSWNLGERAIFNIYTYDNRKNIFNAFYDLKESYYKHVGPNKDF